METGTLEALELDRGGSMEYEHNIYSLYELDTANHRTSVSHRTTNSLVRKS
jgi:hypothetical protein